MALIPGYKHDIFISYVNDDNDPEIKNTDGQVHQFQQYLDRKLKKYNANINIWWDTENLRSAERFDNSIKDAVENSVIMLCLYSRRYTKSAYCQKEMKMFYSNITGEATGIDIGNFNRIIPIMLSNINHTEWPIELNGTSSFEFHNASPKNKYGDPLKVTIEKFETQMQSLRNDLVTIIGGLVDKKKAAAVIKKPAKESIPEMGFSIFFSEVEDALYDRRDGIIPELL